MKEERINYVSIVCGFIVLLTVICAAIIMGYYSLKGVPNTFTVGTVANLTLEGQTKIEYGINWVETHYLLSTMLPLFIFILILMLWVIYKPCCWAC